MRFSITGSLEAALDPPSPEGSFATEDRAQASLIWANVLLMLFTFIWAVFLTDVFIEAPLATGEAASMFVQDQEAFIKIYFGSVLKSMVTLFQVCTLESWANGIMRPAEAIVPGLQWVFIAYVMLMTFGLVNMIVGVFVERCSTVEKHETEFHRAVLEDESNDQLEQLRDLFQGYDEIGNSDGMITLDEFEKMSEDPRFCAILDGIQSGTYDRGMGQNWQILHNFANFWRARSRLYHNEILQENMRLTAFFKLYKICILCTAAISKF